MDKKKNKKVLPIVPLKYNEGDLIFKEGDYGISIYKIIRGKVEIFKETEETTTTLAVLTSGEIIGEMNFLSGGGNRRSASAVALEDVEIEAWHPDRLSGEYVKMPPIIKYLANQFLKRLIAMNGLISLLNTRKAEMELESKKGEPTSSRRTYYRKEIGVPCTYLPTHLSSHVHLDGKIHDISITGLSLEVMSKNSRNFTHDPGDEFMIYTTLPNGQALEAKAKIVYNKKAQTRGHFFLGMLFTEIEQPFKKTLGFFML